MCALDAILSLTLSATSELLFPTCFMSTTFSCYLMILCLYLRLSHQNSDCKPSFGGLLSQNLLRFQHAGSCGCSPDPTPHVNYFQFPPLYSTGVATVSLNLCSTFSTSVGASHFCNPPSPSLLLLCFYFPLMFILLGLRTEEGQTAYVQCNVLCITRHQASSMSYYYT